MISLGCWRWVSNFRTEASPLNTYLNFMLFAIIWWLVLFLVLPWGAKPPETPKLGHATSAPLKTRLPVKCLITTVIAGVVWYVVRLLIAADVFGVN